jgi:hypothetical protein
LTEPESAAVPPAEQVQAQVSETPRVESGQIWECTTNGIKTFSNNPCGDKASLRDVGAINTMDPTPVVHYARSYGPDPRNARAPQYGDQNAYADQNSYADDVYSEPGASESSGNSYAIIQGIAFAPRRRPEHTHHRDHPDHPPYQHNSGPSSRKN